MGFLNYLKGVKEAYQEAKQRGPGFPVNLQGPFSEFMMDISDGDYYLALDTNMLVQYNIFQPNFRHIRFVISQHSINVFENSVRDNDGNAEMAASTLDKLQQAMQAGFKISVVSVTEEDVDRLGLKQSFTAAVMASFYKAKIEIEQSHKDWRTLYLMTLPNDVESISTAQNIGLLTYIAK